MQFQNISLFSEAFGNKNFPAILLNAGAGNQAITWPEEFCKALAANGYFVIRYDYRDTGLSSQINYDENPYTVMDLAKDTINILKKYDLKKAHYVGYSMGGQIAQFIAAFQPEYVTSLILIGTSTDFKPGFNAFEGIYEKHGLSLPNPDYIKWATRKVDFANQSLEEKINDYISTWRYLDGSPHNFDQNFFKQQGIETFTRTKLQEPYLNHAKAMKSSFELHQKAPQHIKTPTLIIQGAKDPVFGVDHGTDLHSKIKNSKLTVLDNFAHAISPQNFDRIVHIVDDFIKNS